MVKGVFVLSYQNAKNMLICIIEILIEFHFRCTTQIEMKFAEPFFGLAYADFDRNSACQTLGKGDLSVRLELPLKGCGTKQVSFFYLIYFVFLFVFDHNQNHNETFGFLLGTTKSVHKQYCCSFSSWS